jgi:uroporphyrinogen decarboxylase
LELIWDLEFVIWDFERYAFCALHNMNWETTFPPRDVQLEKLWREGQDHSTMTRSQGMERWAELISSPEKPIILRGEIWVTPEVLASAGCSQGPKGLAELASAMGADICFFPCSNQSTLSDFKEVVELSHGAGMGCGVTLNGPFQQLSQEKGLLGVLEELGKKPLSLQSQLTRETEKITQILRLTEGLGIDLILIGDDIAYGSGLYFSPALFRELLVPSYRVLTHQISKTIPVLGWHSDGDVSTILPDLVDCGFRFFSLESEHVNLLDFKQTFGDRVTLIGGIRTIWLTEEKLDPMKREEFLKEIKTLVREGGLILASSCGLFDRKFLHTLTETYTMLDNLKDF